MFALQRWIRSSSKKKRKFDSDTSTSKKLNCSLLGNVSDVWIYELLFKPGPQRFKLIEWILTKLQFILPVSPEQPYEERIGALQSFISNCGICKDFDVIKGLSSPRDQILFWRALVDILFSKCEISSELTESEALEDEAYHSYEKSGMEYHSHLKDITELQMKCVANIITSGCMKQIKEVQLFPSHLLRECELLSQEDLQKFKIPDLEEIKKQSKDRFSSEENKSSKIMSDEKQFPFQDYKFESVLPYKELKSLHEKTNEALTDLHGCATGSFNDTHNSLKSLTSHVTHENFYDFGPAFKSAEPHLDSVIQFEKSLQTIKSSDRKVNETSKEAANLKPSTELLSNSQLKDFIEIMKS